MGKSEGLVREFFLSAITEREFLGRTKEEKRRVKLTGFGSELLFGREDI